MADKTRRAVGTLSSDDTTSGTTSKTAAKKTTAKIPRKRTTRKSTARSSSKAGRFYGPRDADRLRVAAGKEPTGEAIAKGKPLP